MWATVAASEATEDGQEEVGDQGHESSISSERIGAAALADVCLGCSSCLTCRRKGLHMHQRSKSLPPRVTLCKVCTGEAGSGGGAAEHIGGGSPGGGAEGVVRERRRNQILHVWIRYMYPALEQRAS